MPDTSPFNVTGFVAPGRAYRLLSQGVTPPTPLGFGRQTIATLDIVAPNQVSGAVRGASSNSGLLTETVIGQVSSLSSLIGSNFLSDSGPNGQNLTQTGTVSSVTSPAGAAFNQGALFGSGGYLSGPLGSTVSQGAMVAGTAFTAECFYYPGTTGGAPFYRTAPNGYGIQWAFEGIGASLALYAVDSGGTLHSISSSSLSTTAANFIQAEWDGSSTLYYYLNGALVGSTSFTSVYAGASNQGLVLGQSEANCTIDEVRISSTLRGTHTAPTSEFASDGTTGCLYHFNTMLP